MTKVNALAASTLHILNSLPNQSHLRIRSIIQHGTIGHGSFGVIKSGVDMFTGDPLLAIETLNYQRRSAAAIKQELEIPCGTPFLDTPTFWTPKLFNHHQNTITSLIRFSINNEAIRMFL